MKNKIEVNKLDWIEGKVKGFLGKELISQANGALKLVKVMPNATYPIHIHPDKTEFAYVLEGLPGFLINSEVHSGKKGDFFIFPFDTKHAIYNNSNYECILLVGSIQR